MIFKKNFWTPKWDPINVPSQSEPANKVDEYSTLYGLQEQGLRHQMQLNVKLSLSTTTTPKKLSFKISADDGASVLKGYLARLEEIKTMYYFWSATLIQVRNNLISGE